MRGFERTRVTIVATVLLGGPGAGLVPGQEAGATIAVRIDDYVGLPAATVAKAAVVAVRLMRTAGIEMRWTLCSAAVGWPHCAAALGPGELSLKILARRHGAPVVSSSVLGYAVVPGDGTPAVYAGILYGRIEPQSHSTLASLPQILGHVAAHEIGHLLLGSNAHAATGLMAAQIQGRDFDRAAQGALHFSPDEAERMRAGARMRIYAGTDSPGAVRTASAR